MRTEDNSHSSIIWPPRGPTHRGTEVPFGRWWQHFSRRIDSNGSRRLDKLRDSSLDIIERIPNPETWGSAPSPFNGLVVGAVQSGKTESMMAVSAMALDRGYQIIIVLTGNNESLRMQTALRFNTTLLGQSDRKIGGQWTIRDSRNRGPLGGFAPNFSLDAAGNNRLAFDISRSFRANEPAVVVVKKEKFNLEALGGALRSLYLDSDDEPTPILVIDDECDEGSVAASIADSYIPRAIETLWKTSSEDVRISYIGYTATAAANLLQDTDNPLYPRDLIYMLRYPQDMDSSLTWLQPEFNKWYTGGDVFYSRFGFESGEDLNFLIQPSIPTTEVNHPQNSSSLREAVIAYFVAGAYRLSTSQNWDFEEVSRYPDPHCMLVQASQNTREHLKWRNAIKNMFHGIEHDDRTVTFPPDLLMEKVNSDEATWRQWFENYWASANRVNNDLRGNIGLDPQPTWETVKNQLVEVFQRTRLKIVNSDDESGSDLDFQPGWTNDVAIPPQDTFAIIVGGQKLSRGITIPGLCTTYYSRESLGYKPYADTTLQLSRWFGYRADLIEFCRVFVSERTREILIDIHENDQDHRLRLASIGSNHQTLSEARIALRESPSYRLTAKIGPQATRYDNLTFSPHNLLFTHMEIADLAEANEIWAADLVERIKTRGCRSVRSNNGDSLGLLSSVWTLEEIADILDGIKYTAHNPNNELYPTPEIYRTPDADREITRSIPPEQDPYMVAAYLRLWDKSDRFESPKFNIAIPYGNFTDSTPFTYPLMNKAINRETRRLQDTWLSQGYTYGAVQYFDNPGREQVDNTGFRRQGCRGLLGLYIIHKDALGGGSGLRREFHTPTLGVSIPAGGPKFNVVTNYDIEG